MTTGWQAHGENFIAWLAPSKIDGFVCVRARVWLDIGVVSIKEATSAVNAETFDAVDVGLSTIITIITKDFFGDFVLIPFFEIFFVTTADANTVKMWVAFGIFIG